jgi:hypothetical protein
MNAYDANSLAAIKTAAELLCKSKDERDLLQMVYDIGVKDGQLTAIRERLDRQQVAA